MKRAEIAGYILIRLEHEKSSIRKIFSKGVVDTGHVYKK